MFKFLFFLAVGAGIGYVYGFSDAQAHDKNIVSRLVERVGGSNREGFKNDVDARVERATR